MKEKPVFTWRYLTINGFCYPKEKQMIRTNCNHYFFLLLLLILISPVWADPTLPVGSAPKPVEFLHFPSRTHTFIWRNWPLVEAERLADVLDTSVVNVRSVAESMGLPPQRPISPEYKNRVYITLIRRNWHLLPYEQLLTLLDFTPEELAHSLREDDFLFIKLGSLKPDCEPLKYTAPTKDALQRCEEIKRIVEDDFGAALKQPYEERFHFLEELNQVKPVVSAAPGKENTRFSPRYIYSYCALYGDPLMDPDLASYPDGLLQKLAGLGVDGVWVHTVLRQLAPSELFPEFGKDCEIRLENLAKLVQRAKQYGIGIYLYVNEPRAMPADFYTSREEMRGVQEGDYYAMCTSNSQVRQWITESLAYVFKNAPGLAGVFTISGSENLTNCASHNGYTRCPNCRDRKPSDIIAEVNTAIEKGVHQGDPNAKVIVWDWGWRDEWVEEIINQLPKSIWLMSVSEWSKPIERGGVKTAVGEYSLSAVGPGPRAIKHWGMAKQAGLKTIAKMQINNTWELSAVPYLPVLDLVAEHCHNLLTHDVNGLMLSWTLGGYPSPNLELIQQFERPSPPTKEEALDTLAQSYFGTSGAPFAREAWTRFSHAFQEFPFHVGVVYRCPSQYGPSNLLYPTPTGYSATMIGFPYDDVNGWRGPYPADVFAGQFSKIAEGWADGLQSLKKAVSIAPSENKYAVESQLRFAQAAQLHFSTVANQVRFTMIRDELLKKTSSLTNEQRKELIKEMTTILRDEITIARQLFLLTRQDSRIGFEASNHYYYIPIDLIEKAVNCRYILDRMDTLFAKE